MCAMEDDNVKALLRRCAGTLLSAVSRMSNGRANGTNTEPEPNGSSRNAPVVITSEDSNGQNNSTFTRGTAATAIVRESAIEEHRRFFNLQLGEPETVLTLTPGKETIENVAKLAINRSGII